MSLRPVRIPDGSKISEKSHKGGPACGGIPYELASGKNTCHFPALQKNQGEEK